MSLNLQTSLMKSKMAVFVFRRSKYSRISLWLMVGNIDELVNVFIIVVTIIVVPPCSRWCTSPVQFHADILRSVSLEKSADHLRWLPRSARSIVCSSVNMHWQPFQALSHRYATRGSQVFIVVLVLSAAAAVSCCCFCCYCCWSGCHH